ncbi:retrovirus-related pol polyprotein from transposon TNT 1-94 [Tanacetum coccineum]
MVTAMLISSGMSQDMWGEAILTATYLLNKIPRKEKEETPYELWRKNNQHFNTYELLCLEMHAYRFIVHESKNPDIQKNTIMESRNASFFENIFPCLSKGTGSSSRLDDKVVQDKRQRDDNDLQDERQDSNREKRKNEPTSYREAVTSSEGQQWREAIKSEIESILQNHTWELVDLPPGCKPLGYKWIFKKKMKADGTVDKYKARVVIQGFRQREGLDYFDTYSPVTRITSIRMIIAIAALRNLEIHQMDVKTAFLNGDLEEEIYMNQPEGFIAPGQEGKVCRLVKSLYGLKQAPKQWHQKFDHTMLESGFKINECDKCVYVKDTSAGYVILCLYVDDMLIVGSNDKIIRSTKDMLKSKFDMKDMGLADVILGIKIIRTHNGLVLSTRPDLAYAVSRLSRYTSNPSYAHWKAITRVLHYLRYSRDYGLHYDKHPAVIEGYSDANWISDIKDSRSTSGYVFTHENEKLQITIRSSFERPFQQLSSIFNLDHFRNLSGSDCMGPTDNQAFGRLRWLLKKLPPQVEPPAEGQSSNAQAMQAVEAWKHQTSCVTLCSEWFDRSFVINVYCIVLRLPIEFWESLGRKYKDERWMVQRNSWETSAQKNTYYTWSLPRLIWLQLAGSHLHRAVDNGQKLYMGNSATADIKGEGDVILKMTSEKELK